jgi:hypothetical protein
VYAALFGTGSFIYGKLPQAIVWTVVFIASGVVLVWVLSRRSATHGER